MDKITGKQVQGMVTHWLRTPVNAYHGSSYGSNLREMLMTPQASDSGDAFIRKLRKDVPVIAAYPPESVNIAIRDTYPDRRQLLIEVGSDLIVAG